MSTLGAKRGDTLKIAGTRKDPISGAALSIAGNTVRCEMVRGEDRHALTCAIVDGAAGTFTATLAPSVTETLAVGVWRADVQFVDVSGAVISGDTFLVSIVEDITGAAD